LKEARSALDFEDLELRARDLLRARPDLCTTVAERYRQVMVDEFQDTNKLQNEIVDLVAGERLFAVGDERQSIYGFRHADVELFRERGAAAAAAGRAASLRTNFRSRPEVLAAVNAAFGSVWEEHEPLAPAPGSSSTPPRMDPAVELLMVDRSKPRWEAAVGADAFGTGVGESIWRGAEARLLAKRIGELAGPGHAFEYGEVAILLRASTDMALYERALVERGIPAYSHGGRGFSEAQQVGDLRAYLAALANPLDELALTMLMASPLVGASLGCVAAIARRSKRMRRDPWWALEQAFRPGGDGSDGLAAGLPADDRARVAAFVERFARERAEAPRLALETVIDRAVTESGYDRVVLAMPGGDRRLANVRKLMRIARRFEAAEGRDLRRFIDHLDEREELRAHEGEAPVEGEARTPAVRLMTIHAAKGLEFPVVCVADLGRPMRGGDDGGIQVAEDGRVGLRLASLSGESRGALEWDRLEEEQTARAEEEERRIFYVAMTRAEEHLVLSGATDLSKWPEPRPLREPLDWIWRAVAPGAKDLLDGAPVGVDEYDTDHGHVRVACTALSPASVDELLASEDRRPGEPAAAAAEPPAAASPPAAADPPAAASPPAAAEPAELPASPPRDRLAAPAQPLPVARLSYSSLEGYRRCGYRFYLERVARLGSLDNAALAGRSRAAEAAAANAAAAPEDGQLVLALDTARPIAAPTEGITPLLRGTIVHQLLERVDMRAPETPDADAIERSLRGHGSPAEPEEIEWIATLIEGFVRSPLRERIAAAQRVRTELAFAFELPAADRPPVLVNGVVDVHAEEPDGLLIVDYKTDPLDGQDPAAVVERGYTTQRLVYALAGLRAGAERVEVAYSLLEAPNDPVAATFGPADRETLEHELTALAGGLLGGDFRPTDTPHRDLCWTCPGRPALCSWGPEMTLRERPANGSVRPPAYVRRSL
jgi:ATP-dependent exoDNAse (exonuclease V) beta subunit